MVRSPSTAKMATFGLAVAMMLTGIGMGLANPSPAHAANELAPLERAPVEHYDVLHLNIHGHVGNADSPDEVVALVDNLTELIRTRQPDLVSLNEVCKSQADGLELALGEQYVLYASLGWWPAVSKPACGGSFGRAVMVRRDLAQGGEGFAVQFPVEVDEAIRPFVCFEITPRSALFCTAHLTSGSRADRDLERARQVQTIHEVFEPYNHDDWDIILAGDLNMRPQDDNLDSIYDGRRYRDGQGIYREADPRYLRVKEATHDGGAPIDYIFINDQPASISPPTITPVPYSDHHVYEATVTITPPSGN